MRSYIPSTTLLLALLAIAAVSLFAVNAAPVPVTVCFPIGGNIYQIMYLPTYYTYQYIDPKVKIVGFVEKPAMTARGVTLALAQNGTDCYVYFGPGNSGIATAVNAVMNSVWMASGVTATEFSDRVNYPLFNRATPTVTINQRAIAALMTHLRWTNVNILCTDNAYGQALTSAISTSMSAAGGQANPKCIGQFADYATTAAVVTAVLASETRVLFIAGNTAEAAYVYGVQAIKALDVAGRLIVVFAEAVCTQSDPLWRTLPGSFCATFATTPLYDPFFAAFQARSAAHIAAERAVVTAIPGNVYSTATANVYNGYSTLLVDGARLVYNALDQYVGLYGKLPPTPAAAAAWVRNQTLPDGFMGPIEIPNGDRLQQTYMRILNSLPGNQTAVVANITSQGNFTIASSIYVLGAQRAIADVPPAIDVAASSSSSNETMWITVGVVLAVLVAIAAWACYVLWQKQQLAVRPLDSSAPFAVMFVGVKNVDEVRDAGDANSAAAFAQVANDLRAAVKASGCYEARRVDESTVMIVAKQVDNALRCAAHLMAAMERVDWLRVMHHDNEMAVLAQVRRERTGTDTQSERSHRSSARPSNVSPQTKKQRNLSDAGSEVKSGLGQSKRSSTAISTSAAPLLHVGIHWGFGMIDHDASLNTVSYVGKVVTRAAEVADVAVAGQVLASREAADAAETEAASQGAAWAAVGAFERLAAWESVAPDTAMFVATALSAESVLAMKAAVKREIDASHNPGGRAQCAGTIAAALQRAEAGLSQRRIGVLSIKVPALRDMASDPSKVAVVAELIDEVTSIAAMHRGEVHSMSNGTILVTVNAGAPAAQPVARAALIAVEVVAHLELQRLSATAGVGYGMALVGRPARDSAFATFGYAVELAEVAQRMAEKHGLKVCAVDANSYDDLAARLHVATIDVVPTPQTRDGMSRLLAIVGERDSTGGEWLYSVGTANAGTAANEHAWRQFVVELEAPAAETLETIDQEITQSTSALWSQLLTTSVGNLRSYTGGTSPTDRDAVLAALIQSQQKVPTRPASITNSQAASPRVFA